MKRHLLIIALLAFGNSCLFAAEAQNSGSQFFKWIQTPRWTLDQEGQERPIYNQLWNGKGAWVPLSLYMRHGNGAEGLGLNERQSTRLAFLRKENELGVEIIREKAQRQDPDIMQAEERVRNATPSNDPQFDNATPEQQREYVTAVSEITEIITGAMDEVVEQTLTPEQMSQVQQLRLQLLPEMGFPCVEMFDSLGLTDEQRRDMEAIKKEMEPEFNQLVDEAMEVRREQFQLMIKELIEMNKTKPFENDEQMSKAMRPAMGKARENKELQKKQRLNSEKGQKFATLFKSRLMNVLTDEQLDKIQKIIDDSPEFIKKLLAEMNARRKAMEKEGQFVPGPDSWRPGDGAPEEFKLKRQGRFPKKTN